MGKWIRTYKGKNWDEFHDCKNSIWDCTCSKCGWKTGNQGINFKFCPICGEKMENAIYEKTMTKQEVIDLFSDILSEYNNDLFGEEYKEHTVLKSAEERIYKIIQEKINDK